jgi:hypothetical protein
LIRKVLASKMHRVCLLVFPRDARLVETRITGIGGFRVSESLASDAAGGLSGRAS